MTEGLSSYISLFVDDAKLLRKIRNHKDCEELWNEDIWMEHDMGNGIQCKKVLCIGNGKEWNETYMDKISYQ